MKARHLLYILLLLAISSCKHNSEDLYPATYRIDGILDLKVGRYIFGRIPTLNLSVKSTGKLQEHVKLSIAGLPAGIGYTFSVPGGIPDFNTQVTFYDTSVVPGSYPVRLVCESPLSGKNSYAFSLTVLPIGDCYLNVIGKYRSLVSCSALKIPNYYDSISVVKNVPGRYQFNNWLNTGATVYGDFDCETQKFIIPAQTSNGKFYAGYGGVSNAPTNGYWIAFTLDSIRSNNCTFSLSK